MPSKCAMVFPFSSHTSTRSLVLRNYINKNLVIKLVSSFPKVLGVDVDNRILICDVRGDVSANITLYAKKLGEEKNYLELVKHYLLVYCISTANRGREELLKWMKSDVNEEADLVHKLTIVRSKKFAALETVIDLHGKLTYPKSVIVPSYAVDDSDCRTAHNIDSDTDTAEPLSDDQFLDLLPPNSALNTAQDGTKCWLANFLANIFPSSYSVAVDNKQGKDAGADTWCTGI